MKNIYFLLLLCFTTAFSYAQSNLSTAQWQEDLRFLQETVHKDYPFLFKKVTQEKFDAEVELLYKSIPDLEEHEIIIGMARIVSLFQYGHTSMGISAWWKRETFNFHQMPYHVMQFSDGVYVQGVHKDYEKALGARVIQVEGVPIEDVLAAVKPVFPAENDQFFNAYGLSYLGIPEVLHTQKVTKKLNEKITLSLEKEELEFQMSFASVEADGFPGSYWYMNEADEWLDARDNSIDPLYLSHLDRIYFFEYLPDQKAVYVRHSQIQDDPEESIADFYNRLFSFIDSTDVERLILDVRLNGGGNNYKNKPIVTGLIKCEKINKAGKLFVIIGRRTFSACQNLVNELSNYTEAIFVGEMTGENINFYGDNRTVQLPNSQIPIRLSFAWWQDKPQWENADGLVPHLAVDMSFEEYRTNQDPVLEAALDFSEENFIMDPMGYLTDLYLSGEMEKLQSEAARIVQNPAYAFFDFESEFIEMGQNLLKSGNLEAAIASFGFVVQFFSESAPAWAGLGEAYRRSAMAAEAKGALQRAASLDPHGPAGEQARKSLEEMEKGD